jgi:hypothetical protein
MTIQWDSGHCSANITLSNGNLTATATASTSANIVRATVSQSTGKYYLEYIQNSTAGQGDVGMGLCNASQAIVGNTTVYLGSGNPSNGMADYTGAVYLNGGDRFAPAGETTPNVACMAVDFGHGKIWYGGNGSGALQWNSDIITNQNPATNTGGYDISAGGSNPFSGFGTGTAFYPAVDCETNTRTLTVNFGGSAYTFALPTGFLNWDGSGGGGGAPPVIIPPHPSFHGTAWRRRPFIKGWRPTKRTIIPLPHLVFPAPKGLTTKVVRPPKKRKLLKIKPFNRFPPQYVKGSSVPTTFALAIPGLYGAGLYGQALFGSAGQTYVVKLQPQVPNSSARRARSVLWFKKRKPFALPFRPKRLWSFGGTFTPGPHPPTVAGLARAIPRVKIKRIHKWKPIKVAWPNNPFVIDIFKKAQLGWMYGAGPFGGPYGAAGQLFVLPFITYPLDGSVYGTVYYGLGARPFGSNPFGAAGQVLDAFNTQDHIPGLQGGLTAPAGSIRVAQPYVSVVRSAKPALAQTRKAAQSLQQLRTTPPKLVK